MKKIILFVLVFASFSIIAKAQTEPTGKKASTKEEKKKLKEDLNLSKDQKGQLKDVKNDYKEKEKAIKDDKTLTESQKQEKIKTLKTEKKGETEKILTPEQKQKVKQFKKDHPDKKG